MTTFEQKRKCNLSSISGIFNDHSLRQIHNNIMYVILYCAIIYLHNIPVCVYILYIIVLD
jgi:hypothetical protein